MTYSLTWLPDVLRSARLDVEEVPGWQTCGIADMGEVKGVLLHHTAGPKTGDFPSLSTICNGRPDLSPPLAQLGLGRSGKFYVIAAGKAQHAGQGVWQGITSGNSHFIGIEAENTGLPDDPWPEVQMDAYARGVAAILKHIGAGSEMCAGHREYATPPGRKVDPAFDMVAFRKRLDEILA